MNIRYGILFVALAVVLNANIVSLANSLIYTDGIGRLHFLGRDQGPVAKSNQTLENFSTNIIYKDGTLTTDPEGTEYNNYWNVNNLKRINEKSRTKATSTATTGAMDASNSVGGNTNLNTYQKR